MRKRVVLEIERHTVQMRELEEEKRREAEREAEREDEGEGYE